MIANYFFSYQPDWRTAPMAFWVHIAVPGPAQAFNPPAPLCIPHKGYVFLHVEFEQYTLEFSTPAQIDHFIDILSAKPRPTSEQLSLRRGLPIGPNSHWLSRLPAKLKSPRKRAKLVQELRAIRNLAVKPGVHSSFSTVLDDFD